MVISVISTDRLTFRTGCGLPLAPDRTVYRPDSPLRNRFVYTEFPWKVPDDLRDEEACPDTFAPATVRPAPRGR